MKTTLIVVLKVFLVFLGIFWYLVVKLSVTAATLIQRRIKQLESMYSDVLMLDVINEQMDSCFLFCKTIQTATKKDIYNGINIATTKDNSDCNL